MKTRANMIFRRFGRAYHLYLHDADDLAGVLELDEAHWVYINAANSTLRGDEMFFALVNVDQNGRIRPHEIKQAIQWLLEHLSETTDVARSSNPTRLRSISNKFA